MNSPSVCDQPCKGLAGCCRSDSRGIDIPILTYYHASDVSECSDRVRGSDDQTGGMFSYLSLEQRVRRDHPLRAIRRRTDAGARRVVAALHEEVVRHRPAVDSAGAVAAGPADSAALYSAQ